MFTVRRVLVTAPLVVLAACTTEIESATGGHQSSLETPRTGWGKPIELQFHESVIASAFKPGFTLQWYRTMGAPPVATVWREVEGGSVSPMGFDDVGRELDKVLSHPHSAESALMTSVLHRIFEQNERGPLAPQLMPSGASDPDLRTLESWCAALVRANEGFRSCFLSVHELKDYGVKYPTVETGVFSCAEGYRIVSIGVVPTAGISIREGIIAPPVLLRVTEFVGCDGTYIRDLARIDGSAADRTGAAALGER